MLKQQLERAINGGGGGEIWFFSGIPHETLDT